MAESPLTIAKRGLYRVEEVCIILSLGRTHLYDEIRTGRLRSVKIGKSIRIPAEALTEYVEQAKAEAGWHDPA
jgi:excisionase family DNA binding protein